jgi:hypothetical protein
MQISAGKALVGLVVLFVLMQLIVPAKTNPRSDPAVSLRAVRPGGGAGLAVMERSCRDCHSNDTVWPWYSRIAPVSWLVAHDVSEGRGELNMSEFGTYDAAKQQQKLEDACEQVKAGEMPTWIYTLQHRDARLQPGDVEAICALSKAAAPATRPTP